jgi:hypothetical protein
MLTNCLSSFATTSDAHKFTMHIGIVERFAQRNVTSYRGDLKWTSRTGITKAALVDLALNASFHTMLVICAC